MNPNISNDLGFCISDSQASRTLDIVRTLLFGDLLEAGVAVFKIFTIAEPRKTPFLLNLDETSLYLGRPSRKGSVPRRRCQAFGKLQKETHCGDWVSCTLRSCATITVFSLFCLSSCLAMLMQRSGSVYSCFKIELGLGFNVSPFLG